MTEHESYGVGDDGEFNKKTVEVIREGLREAFKEEMGSDFEFRPNSPLQQIIDASAVEIARQWDASEAAYYASFYEDAFGEQLDKQLALAGFSRQQLRGATGEATFSRDSEAPRDIDIPEGTVVTTRRTETRPPIPFNTTEDATIFEGEEEAEDVPIEALAPWEADVDEEWLGEETNVSADSIVRFDSPISGVDEVTNPKETGEDGDEDFRTGRDRESDAEFKLRYENSFAEAGTATVNAMMSSITEFDEDILSTQVDEVHDTDEGYGPEVTVFAPDADDDTIAQAILESRSAGLDTFGDDEGESEDDIGQTRTEKFNRAEPIGVVVHADLTTTGSFREDGVRNIEDNVLRFIGGEARDDTFYPGLGIGEDIVYDQVKQRVMEERGVVRANVLICNVEFPDQIFSFAPLEETDETTYERGIVIEANEGHDAALFSITLADGAEDIEKLYVYDDDGELEYERDISELESGEHLRIFDHLFSWESGEQFTIAVDGDGDEYTYAYDDDPEYPYEGEPHPEKDAPSHEFLEVVERYHGEKEDDEDATDTLPVFEDFEWMHMNDNDIETPPDRVPTTEMRNIVVNEDE